MTIETLSPQPSLRLTARAATAPIEVVADVHDRLLDDLDVRALERLPDEDAQRDVREAAGSVLGVIAPGVTGTTRQAVLREVVNEVLGFGPIQPLLDDPEVDEIMVNGPDEVYCERAGVIYAATARFRDTQHIRRIADRIVAPFGRRLDEGSPMVDARLPDGSRVNVVLPPIAVSSPTITIRKFKPGSTEPATRFGCRDTQTGAPLKLG